MSIRQILFIFLILFSFATPATQWREVAPDNMVVMTLPHGKVVFELAPFAAPTHVKQFKKLVKQGYYQHNKFYRVIDGFVAQAGPEQRFDNAPNLAIEPSWHPAKSWQWQPVQKNDMFSDQTGFSQGFALSYQTKQNTAWLTHCPGVLAMARGNEPNTGSGHFYITIGQAPRYLDNIMTIFGRVIYGMDKVQAIKRTQVIAGEPKVPVSEYTEIINMQLMSDLAKNEQIKLAVEVTESDDFAKKLQARRDRKSAFFYKKPKPVLDVCQIPVKTKRLP